MDTHFKTLLASVWKKSDGKVLSITYEDRPRVIAHGDNVND